MSELSDGFADLQREFADVTSKPQTVKINGKNYPAIPSEITYDDIKLAGGEGDSGGGRVDIAQDKLRKQPEHGDEIEVDGNTWDVLQVVNTNGVTWTITFGQMVSE